MANPQSSAGARRWVFLFFATALAFPGLAASRDLPARPSEDLATESWINSLPEDVIQPAIDGIVNLGGTTRYLSFSPGAFVVRNSDTETYLFEANTPGAIDAGPFAAQPCFYAPLRLPQGATVVGFVVYAREPDSGDLYGALHRKSLGSLGLSSQMATVASSGAQSDIRVFTDFTISDATIENRYFYYYLELCLPVTDTELHGVYVSYTP